MLPTRFFIIPVVMFSALISSAGEDAAGLHKKGIEALKESQAKPEAVVTAARCFAKASALYEANGQPELAVETNSFLYYCKKKMTLKDIDAFLKSENAGVSERLKEVESKPVAPSEAQTWLERADSFAKTNANEQFLITVRYFEVAERFKDSEAGRSAMSKSLEAMLKVIAAQKTAPPAVKAVAKAAPPKIINLLPLIDPKKDAVFGKWGFSGAVLVGDKADAAKIEIPYQPPEEYDFRIVFMRVNGQECVIQILSKAEHQFMSALDAWNSTVSGVEMIDSKHLDDNETTYKGKLITNNHWHTSVVQVRNSGVKVLFDDKTIVIFSKPYDTLSLHPHWKLNDVTVLGLGHKDKVVFSTIELIEITGTGKKTR